MSENTIKRFPQEIPEPKLFLRYKYYLRAHSSPVMHAWAECFLLKAHSENETQPHSEPRFLGRQDRVNKTIFIFSYISFVQEIELEKFWPFEIQLHQLNLAKVSFSFFNLTFKKLRSLKKKSLNYFCTRFPTWYSVATITFYPTIQVFPWLYVTNWKSHMGRLNPFL